MDCGFGTFVGVWAVAPRVVYARLGALVEGAALPSREPLRFAGAQQVS
jgi:hypothetical protein